MAFDLMKSEVLAEQQAICDAATASNCLWTVSNPADLVFRSAALAGYKPALELLRSYYEVLRKKDGTILIMQARNDDLLNRSRALSRRLRGMRKHAKQQAAWAAARILELQEQIHNQTVRNVALCKRLKEAAKTEGASDA